MKRREFIGQTTLATAGLLTATGLSPLTTPTDRIIDAHCHAWSYWPYTPAVPDPETRGNLEHLLLHMNQHNVSAATIVAAQIDHNSHNNEYVNKAVREHPGRFHLLADVDSYWSRTYHKPGSADRLKKIITDFSPLGITHYLDPKDDASWLHSKEGLAFLNVLQEKRMIFSVACSPSQMKAICTAAQNVPVLPFLCHHLAGLSISAINVEEELRSVLAAAAIPNIYLKWSGFAYASLTTEKHEYPYYATHVLFKPCYEHFGTRMVWGSDFPVVSQFMTYQQSLEAFRTHCNFVSNRDRTAILGDTLYALIRRSTA